MDSSEFFHRHLARARVIAILRGFPSGEAAARAIAARKQGVELVEVQIQNHGGRDTLLAVSKEAGKRDQLFGAGSVLSAEDGDFAADLGSSSAGAPVLNAEVCCKTQALNLAHLPGVTTATGILAALLLGYTWSKAFPAKELSASWIAPQLDPFRNARFVATGGVNALKPHIFPDAGAFALGVGNAITDPLFYYSVLRAQTKGRNS